MNCLQNRPKAEAVEQSMNKVPEIRSIFGLLNQCGVACSKWVGREQLKNENT
jgi:bacterioferritin-associated ferredoxin